MQIKRIIPGQWYETKQGPAKCLKVSTAGVITMEIAKEDGKTSKVYLKPSEIQHEIANGRLTMNDETPPAPCRLSIGPSQDGQRRGRHLRNK